MKYLELKGRRLACVETMPLGLAFDLAEGMDNDSELKKIAAMSRALKAIVVKEAHGELHEVLYQTKDPVGFDDLNNALGTLMKEYSDRPFEQRSSSPAGPRPTGGSSRRVSLWPVTEEKEPTSSKDKDSLAS